MDAVRKAIKAMGPSMQVIVQHIYDVMDLCNDGQLRKLSAQGFGQASHESAGTDASAATTVSVPQPTSHRSVELLC